MILGNHSAKSKTGCTLVLVAGWLLAYAGAGQAALAQDTLSSEQDSLLPPEVVPLDPATASSMAAKQAEQRAQSGGTAGGSVPGLVGSGGANGMITAQDARKAVFNSLYNQGQLPQSPSQPQWQSGVTQNQMIGQNAPAGYPMGGMPGQNPAYAPYTASNSAPAQSQTLTGGTKQKNKTQNIRRSGVSNTLSAIAAFGAGALTAGALMRPQYPMMGLGMFGLTMTGFGVRNGFRL